MSKTETEIKKENELKEKAKIQALAYIEKEKIQKEEREKKERDRNLKRSKKIKKKCSSEKEQDFHIKIKYKCETICGNKYYTFNNNKETYPFIDKNDIILYDNPKHSNNNREAVVINYKMSGTGAKNIDKNKRIPKFLIKFIEPLDKLPFYYLDVNGLKVKTNKKIVIMDDVPYDNLKLVYSTIKSDVICLNKEKIKKNISSIDNLLKEKYDSGGFNAPLNFKEFIKRLFNDTNKIIKKVEIDKVLKKNKTTYKLEQGFTTKLKSLINHLKKFNPQEPLKKKEKEFKKIIDYFNTVLNFKYSTSSLDESNKHLKSKEELIIYIFIYNLLVRRGKKNLKYVTDFKDTSIENVNNESIKKFIEIVKKIQENLNKLKSFFVEKYQTFFKDEKDPNLENKIMKIVIKNLADIKKGLQIKPYTYKHFIMDQLKLKVLKYFKIDKEFHPSKVYFKYANPELVKIDLKEKLEQEKEANEQFIKINKSNKLVNPTNDKVFILTNINSVFNKNKEKKINDIDDYFDNNVNIDTKNNQIEVKLEIGLTIQDKKSKDIIFEDKTSQSDFFKSVKSFVTSVQDNMECVKSKENIKKDIKDIKKKLGLDNETKKSDKNEESDEIEEQSQ